MSLFPEAAAPQPNPAPLFKMSYQECNTAELLSQQLVRTFSHVPYRQAIVVVCVGTDRSTGDSLGPLVGSKIQSLHHPRFGLFGTLEEPVHAMNLAETIASINKQYDSPFIVAIDACLGQLSSVGNIQLGEGPIKPGAGVNKELPPVGDVHIKGIVNVGGFMEFFVLQNTRLSVVMQMSDVIASALSRALTRTLRPTTSSLVRSEQSLLSLQE
ncbi:spore protease YyaC [Paenibacillus sp. y28]|uniref:spore protease YyaC n=1 Tax=Paenibacillus sp. y28 TaxID=3129110 RepID=UPI00301AD857